MNFRAFLPQNAPPDALAKVVASSWAACKAPWQAPRRRTAVSPPNCGARLCVSRCQYLLPELKVVEDIGVEPMTS